MKERILILLMTMVMVFTIITPGMVPRAEAAGGTVTKTYTATADTMQLNGQPEYDGIYDHDGDAILYVGMSNNDGFVNVRNRMAASFNLGAPEGTVVSAELVLTVATVLRVPDHTLYMEARGTAVNNLDHNFSGSFPSVDTTSPYADKFTAKSTAEVPMGTYLQDQTITLNVKSAVDAFTDGSDRNVTFILNGNEADMDSGRFLFYSLEAGNAAFRPKLVVTYQTEPVNTPPTGSFTITEGAATSSSIVSLSVTGSDPDAGDSVTGMRFANSAANLSAASWLPFSNTATFILSGGDGSKTIYMQLMDSNNGVSSNSSQTILLDQTAPTGTIIINDGAAWTNSATVTLKGTYTDGSGSGIDQARLSNINGTWQTSWFNIADLNGRSWVLPAGEGAKTVYVQYKDKVNNSSSSTISHTITVDTIAPVITNVVNNKAYNSTVAPQFTEGSGLLNGNPYSSGTDITQDGAYTLIVSDPAGNSTTVTFKIDTIAPDVVGVANGGIYNTSKTITFNEGTATLNGAAFVNNTQVTLDGVYTLVVTDDAGNKTTVIFEIDKSAPTVTGITNNGNYKETVTVSFNEGTANLNGAAFANGADIDQDGSYTLVVTDVAGNVTTVSFKIDTVAPIVTDVTAGGIYKAKVTPSFNEGTATLNGAAFASGTEIEQDGVYTLVVTDAAGNAATVGFTIDTTAPVVTGVANNGLFNSKMTAEFNEGTATLNGAAFASGTEIEQDGVYALVVTDAAGNVTTVSFTIDTEAPAITGVSDGGVYLSATPEFNEGTATLNGAAFASGTEIEQDGIYTLAVTDTAGNAATVQFQIDTIEPTGTVIIQAGAEWTNEADVALTLTSDDGNNGSGVVEMRFSNNGSDWGSWEPSEITKAWSLVAGDGEKSVHVQFKDKAGNVSGAINDMIKLDQMIPTGSIVINNGESTTSSKSVAVTLTSSDGAGSSVTEMRFSEDNLTWLNWENVLPATNWSFTGSSGLKKLYVQYRDAAGNVSVANMATITYQESSGSNGGTSGSTGGTAITPSVDVVISMGSKSENAAKVDVKIVEGKKVTTVFLEEAQLQGMLNESGNKPVITITVRNHSDTVNWEMNAALLQSLENNHAIIQVITENVIYTLPLDQVSVNKWRDQLGAADIPLGDMKIKVEMINLPISAFENSGDGEVSLVVPAVSFSIEGLYGNKEIELNQFDTFVERRFAIPAGIDAARITTGVKLMSDGTIIHIPTKVVREGERDYAILNSMTNSIYGLIYNKKTFNDVSGHWAQESINDLASRLVINGADEQRFLPDSEITRAEFMAIMIRALGLSSANKTYPFKDIEEKAWYHQAVQIGYSYGLVDGYSDGSFNPNEKITRQEAMVILSRAMKLVELNKEIDDMKQQELVNHFADSEQLAAWARQAAALTIEIGVIGGNKGELRPLHNITRAETAAIIQRLLQKAEFI
ncbi:MAG: S-layer homology domain-containing protein [Candidatus Pristimantibacillus sp.]